ncbi:MAG TPA: CorA family divalent cation transporter [Solirubrobacteraceae bacterium]|nr:CorA family divalent cation transporter [Solirubrobacteraceae bacterium]
MRQLAAADLDELRELCSRGDFFWLDLNDPPAEELSDVADVLALHELALEDTQDFGQRPKLDTYGEQLLIVYFGASTDESDAPCPVEVHVHIARTFVLTVHRTPCQQFDVLREAMKKRPPENEGILIYRVIDALTDSILDVLQAAAEVIDGYEQRVFRRPQASDRDKMAMLRRHLNRLRRILVIQRQVFDGAAERIAEIPSSGGDIGPYLSDVSDHLWRALDEVDAAREILQGMLETYTNEVQERLTIVATIFLPLTMATGFFGMNFNWLITHIGSVWTFWLVGVGGLLTSLLLILLWLRHSGLLNRSPRE